jgi:hypothetical protein
MRFRRSIAVVGIAGFLGEIALVSVSFAASQDAYAALKPYAGTWTVVSSRGKTSKVANICARTGLFFVCEQSINGAAKALVVFLPQGGGRYRTQTLGADGAEPGHWFGLRITDADWVYMPEGADPRERTLNHYIDADHVHFDVQKKSGEDWKTTLSGDETRTN